MPQPLRILYAAGPGDVIGTYRHWVQGRDDPAQVAVTYSGQFYDLCKANGYAGYVISFHDRREIVRDGDMIIEHRPAKFRRGPAPLYHVARVWYGLRLTMSAVRFGADVALVMDGTHWFALGLLPWFGIKPVLTLHCVLWPRHEQTVSGLRWWIRTFNRRFFQKQLRGILSLSTAIKTQALELLGGKPVPIVSFLPSYRPAAFAGFGPPAAPVPAFRVFFAGRIEKKKGVFDLLDICKKFVAEGRNDIEFDLCGEGDHLDQLRAAASEAGITDRFRCHGHVTKPFMRDMYERCHVVVVPTTTEFVEGFNKVVAEGVLAGRPVITSSVCPALEYVRDAVVEVPADDGPAYGRAILQLKNDADLYAAKVAGCHTARGLFYDPRRSWGHALTTMLEKLRLR